jgi:mannose-6-phosphate isomerase-like protein (cupin superfamily)
MTAIAKTPAQYRAFRLPGATNRFALLFDPVGEAAPFVACVEIFDPGGATPPNRHARAHEMFFVLAGEGVAEVGGRATAIATGDSLLLPPGEVHVIRNTGPGRLYCLTTMVPDEDFAALIRSGEPAELDALDLAVLGRAQPGARGA